MKNRKEIRHWKNVIACINFSIIISFSFPWIMRLNAKDMGRGHLRQKLDIDLMQNPISTPSPPEMVSIAR